MTQRALAAWLTLATLLTPACSKPAKDASPPSAAAAPAAAAPSLPSFPGPFNEKTALALVLKEVANPRWQVDPGGERLVFDKDAVEQYAKSVAQYPFHQNGAERVLFLYETAPVEDNTCHACRVTVGAAVFSHQRDTWQVDRSTPEMSEHGSWGASVDAAELTLLRIGRDQFGLRETSCDMHFGHRECMLSIYHVAADFPRVFLLVQSLNNEGNCSSDADEWHDGVEPCETSEATLSIVPGGNSEYDDIAVATNGMEMNPAAKKVEPFERKTRFTFRDGTYQKTPG